MLSLEKKSSPRIQKCSWLLVEKEVAHANPKLAQIINQLALDDEFPLIKLIYGFGDEIVKNGAFYVPFSDRQVLPLTDGMIASDLQHYLGYSLSTVPLGLVLKGQLEYYMTMNEKIMPHSLVREGSLIGLTHVFDISQAHHPEWYCDLTAGARSIFMASKISNKTSHKRLSKHYNISVPVPEHFIDHWKVFRKIAQLAAQEKPWQCEILCFSHKWIQKLKDSAWQSLYYYFLEMVQHKNVYWINQCAWSLLFQQFTNQIEFNNKSINKNLALSVLLVSAGVLPGFVVATNNQFAPIDLLKQAYIEIYKIKNCPLIMQPSMLDLQENNSTVYLSLLINGRRDTRTTALEELQNILSFMTKFLAWLKERPWPFESTYLQQLLNDLQLGAFSYVSSASETILSNFKLMQIDPLLKTQLEQWPNQRLPVDSIFFKECLRLSVMSPNDCD